MNQAAAKRNWIALAACAIAIRGVDLHPAVSLAIILGIAALYFVPNALKQA
jgi:hypothetical protein